MLQLRYLEQLLSSCFFSTKGECSFFKLFCYSRAQYLFTLAVCALQVGKSSMPQKPAKLSCIFSHGVFLLCFGLGSAVCHAKVWSDLANLFHNLVHMHWSWEENLGSRLDCWYTNVFHDSNLKKTQVPYFQTLQIERVQNPFFWKAYQIKKREMDNKNGNRNNERLLFHGTSKESLTLINTGGFNRSYAGMHGNTNFKTTLVFLNRARTDLPCHLYSSALYAKLFVLLNFPTANKKQNCQEIHRLWRWQTSDCC